MLTELSKVVVGRLGPRIDHGAGSLHANLSVGRGDVAGFVAHASTILAESHTEVVSVFVEFEVAVSHLSPAGW